MYYIVLYHICICQFFIEKSLHFLRHFLFEVCVSPTIEVEFMLGLYCIDCTPSAVIGRTMEFVASERISWPPP